MENDTHNLRLERIRQSGNKLTHARLTVLRALEMLDGHSTSNEVLEAVDALDASIGRASVFRTLELFTQLGIICPTHSMGGAARYVLLPDGHHHHIVCLKCNRTIDFEDCGLESLQAHLEATYRVHLSGHLLEFFGLCHACFTETASASGGAP